MMKGTEPVTSSLRRISRYLPNARLDHASRVTVDNTGHIWVDEDKTLIILRGHLLIERELADICERCFLQPDALPERLSFDTRLRLVRALLGDNEFPKIVYDILKDLNRIRNNLAHKLEAHDFNDDLRRFIERFFGFDDFKCRLTQHDNLPMNLNHCIIFLVGMLGGIPALPQEITGNG